MICQPFPSDKYLQKQPFSTLNPLSFVTIFGILFQRYMMMKPTMTFMAIMMMAQAGLSQSKAAAVAGETTTNEAMFIRSTMHDFGAIPQGKPVYHVFKIENRSSDTLRIDQVLSSCGCTTPVYQKEPIAPGSATELKVGFNAEADGLFDKNITIYYNQGKIKTLNIRGNVWGTPNKSVPDNSALNIFKQFP